MVDKETDWHYKVFRLIGISCQNAAISFTQEFHPNLLSITYIYARLARGHTEYSSQYLFFDTGYSTMFTGMGNLLLFEMRRNNVIFYF